MPTTEPVLTPPGAGETVRYPGGSTAEMKVSSAQTAGDYGAVLYTVRAGDEPPPHIHSREDELVHVIAGEITARVGDTTVEVGPGAFAALPRGVPHGFTVRGEQAVLLLVFSPGGLESFFVPGEGPPDPGAFGLEMLAAA